MRVGIINIMPKAETYEASLLAPLSRWPGRVLPLFVRLESHTYQSSDVDHIARHYHRFEELLQKGPLDGLLLTGAPVEGLPFEEVRYFSELREILRFARSELRSTLGLCWGALALGHLVGLEKVLFAKKLFGVFPQRWLPEEHPFISRPRETFSCAHSRHSGIEDRELEKAAGEGRVRLLAHGEETGYSLFETPDHRFLMHLGHPEYEAHRLTFEWERDQRLGRADVGPPRNFDPTHPSSPWVGHRNDLFARWLEYLAAWRAPEGRKAGEDFEKESPLTLDLARRQLDEGKLVESHVRNLKVLARKGPSVSLGVVDDADKTIAPYGTVAGKTFSVCIEGGGIDQKGFLLHAPICHGVHADGD